MCGASEDGTLGRGKPVTGKESFSRDVSSSSFLPFHQQFSTASVFPANERNFPRFFSKTTSESGEAKSDRNLPRN
jgi:hypothetical protein